MILCRHYISSLNTFMRKGKDPEPDPYFWLVDSKPDPGGPKTCGSCGPRSGSPTLKEIILFGWSCCETTLTMSPSEEEVGWWSASYQYSLTLCKDGDKHKSVLHCMAYSMKSVQAARQAGTGWNRSCRIWPSEATMPPLPLELRNIGYRYRNILYFGWSMISM